MPRPYETAKLTKHGSVASLTMNPKVGSDADGLGGMAGSRMMGNMYMPMGMMGMM